MNCNDIISNSSSNVKNNTLLNKDIVIDKKSLKKSKLKLLNLKQDILNTSIIYKDKVLKIKKRLQKKIYNTYNFFLEKDFLLVLPIIDSIEATINVLDNSNDNNSTIYIVLKDIQKKFLYVFKKYGVSIINSINIPFNPDFHQAISIDFSGKYKNNFISSIIQKGYSLNNRLLRPALVSVSQIKKN
ncbi:nucleotide exchange factor GrpE [Buchnera aphidicola]|uniref:Protein GrpE n=1 Tax=Buchnera aphidicola (Cinara curvipes) TaxID=2518975 RepID=A0A451D6R5_9GAMM|nr:nucleotide exchange factor GrpE [Buchnera aphidicola]VFP81455.1 Protein GrpE [Buchnera aphidicola (Cinara curvipes)]